MIKKTLTLGIIAEDDSDISSLRKLVHKIALNDRIKVIGRVGHGCGRIISKCNIWANDLKIRGCSVLILVHDLDENEYLKLMKALKKALSPSPILKYLISIPIIEIEAWLLSDVEAIKKALNLKKLPKSILHPEEIHSPKEHLGEIISKASNGEKSYLNTEHNEKIAQFLSINKAKKLCPSFASFYDFIIQNFKSQ